VSELTRPLQQIESATELAGLTYRLDQVLKTELAPIKFSRCMERLDSSDVALKNLSDIIAMTQLWCDEMRSYLPNKNIITVEVMP